MNPLIIYFSVRNCKICEKEFKPATGNQKFCSQECYLVNQKEYKKKWENENRDKINQRSRNWYHKNLEKARETKRKWNNTHPERMDNRKPVVLTKEDIKKISNRTQAKRNAIRYGMIKICRYKSECSGRIELHHKDQDTGNNSRENLEYLCHKHHSFIHRKAI